MTRIGQRLVKTAKDANAIAAGELELTPYDSAAYLDSEEAIAAYLDEAFRDGDLAMITHALGVVARARGMSHLARDAGLERAGLYRSLAAGGNPEFGTVLRLMKAMGLRLSVEPSTPANDGGPRRKRK
jgi:probable addiction module antidote protein